jgi:hypothetical protein
MAWTNFLKLTDIKHCRFDVKYDKTHIVGMYICITANGSIENLYKKLRESNSSININAINRRVRFIIKFEGEPIYPRIGYGDVMRIYEKGNKQDINNRIFDIEFNKGTTLDAVKKVTLDLGVKGNIYEDTATGLYYWRRFWNNIINEYSTIEDIDDITDRVITNIPKSKSGKRILVASSEDKNFNSSKQKKNEESDSSSSSLSSNDSTETRKIKKRKQVIKNNTDIDVEFEQAQIRFNYDELNNKKRKLDIFLDSNELLEDNKLDISQGLSKEIKRIRDDKGLNRLFKKL